MKSTEIKLRAQYNELSRNIAQQVANFLLSAQNDRAVFNEIAVGDIAGVLGITACDILYGLISRGATTAHDRSGSMDELGEVMGDAFDNRTIFNLKQDDPAGSGMTDSFLSVSEETSSQSTSASGMIDPQFL